MTEGTPQADSALRGTGESGDSAARREAEDAIVPVTKDGEAGDALGPSPDARRRTARQGEGDDGNDTK
ncbi:hypothetical protein [Streptomyces sp. TBY4]|uniref:hypothetical protein n=1 Tax=Streptomyces sp. TBY4 TaxID=2962030 RepID=UPI0020B8B9EA|nr:hypothetical protein [Streptomyces sp. TBY4]MCP3754581.1 hypothetical protein [Streptomyces sp. TBY4]